ncbi:MAG: dihydrolipoyl dehydrogenase [Proteobacteria bacterium]|nr:dihydrolipoyl dehydrogenase [Pseudomonadota bacterium]
MSAQEFDLIVIGAGPAGYVGAIRAAQLGMKVALVEKSKTLGGTCLNVGCIPSKALLDSSEKYEEALHHFADHGVEVKGVKLDLKKMLGRKDAVVKQLTGGVDMLMKKNKVTVLNGWGKLTAADTVSVDGTAYKAKKILIAAGSEPVELPHVKFDGKDIVTSTEALDFASVPAKLVVIGAGVIGLELGSVWRRLGSDVTLVDMAPAIAGTMDADITKEAQKIFTKQGLKFELEQKIVGVAKKGKGYEVELEGKDGKSKKIPADKVLVAVGRRPNTAKLGLAEVGVKVDNRGFIDVDAHYQTSVPGIYAVGDCIPGPMLAHKGEEEGVAAVELMAGQAGHVNYSAIAGIVYTWPEMASVGMTEREVQDKGIEYKVGKFHFRANGRAIATANTDGFVKIISDAKTDRMLGAHIIGANASEMIAELAVGMEFAASAEDIARSVHAHPTMTEAIKEAALAVDRRALHS